MARQLLTTRLLDQPGKIGPFFYQEFLLVFLGTICLFMLTLLYSLFLPLSVLKLVGIPATFLLLVGMIRWLLKQRITSQWYVHKWVARQWIRPYHLVPRTWKSNPLCVWPKKS